MRPSADTLMNIDAVLARIATKSDVQQVVGEVRKWILGTAIALGVAGITVMTFVLNNAAPKAPTVQPAPIIITIPAAQPASSAR